MAINLSPEGVRNGIGKMLVGKVPWSVLEEGISRPCAVAGRSSDTATAFAAWSLGALEDETISGTLSIQTMSRGNFFTFRVGRGRCDLHHVGTRTGKMRASPLGTDYAYRDDAASNMAAFSPWQQNDYTTTTALWRNGGRTSRRLKSASTRRLSVNRPSAA